MSDRYYLNGKSISLNTNNTLGNGGQAVVVKYGHFAIKIWKSIQPDQVEKVRYLISEHPIDRANFLAPTTALTNAHGELVGYGMPLLPDHFREAGVLFNKTLKRDLQLTLPVILTILHLASQDLDYTHQIGGILGYVSGRNFAFTYEQGGVNVYWYDIDSWQIGGYRCPVWTELFLCPNLYDQTQRNGPTFSLESDFYGLNTIAFWSLFNVNPYSQPHPKYSDFRDRAQRGLYLLSPGIAYPFLAPHPDTLTDELLAHFEKVFAKHQYRELTPALIDNYQNSLVECQSCTAHYPNNRKSCPQCSKKTPAVSIASTYQYLQLLQTAGPLLFSKFQNGTLFAVSQERNGLYLWTKTQSGPATSQFINLDSAGVYRFDIVGGDYLTVNPTDSEMLYITPVNSPGSAWITSLTSLYQGNRLAVFTGTNRGLLRLAGNSLLQGEIRNGYLVDHTMPITLTDGQSWIWSDNEGNNIVSLSRFFSQYHYQLISHGRRYEVAISPLEDHDSLQDTHVDFGSDSICLRRIFKRSGRMYVIYDIFDHYGQSVTATIQ